MLGKPSKGGNKKFLNFAGGAIWDKKGTDTENEFYEEEEYSKKDGSVGVRKGYKYGDITGQIVGVSIYEGKNFTTLNVTMKSDAGVFVLSAGKGSNYGTTLAKILLMADLSKPIYLKPYYFINEDNKKLVQGISGRQGHSEGQKFDLKQVELTSKPQEWFKGATKKEIRRFYEDQTDELYGILEDEVISKFDSNAKDFFKDAADKGKDTAPKQEAKEEVKEEPKDEAPKRERRSRRRKQEDESPKEEASESSSSKVSPIKMKKFLKDYIEENYGEEYTLPKLTKVDLEKWYELALAEEELPIEDNDNDAMPVTTDDVEDQQDSADEEAADENDVDALLEQLSL